VSAVQLSLSLTYAVVRMLLFVADSKDDVELLQRKRVKVEQEPEEVSTVVSGKVVVSTLGTARIVGRKQPVTGKKTGHRLLAKTTPKDTAEKDNTVQKKSSLKRPDSSKIAVKKQEKATKQKKETVYKALTEQQREMAQRLSKPAKQSAPKQPPKKKKRLI